MTLKNCKCTCTTVMIKIMNTIITNREILVQWNENVKRRNLKLFYVK